MVVLVRLILPGKGGFEQKRHHMAQLLHRASARCKVTVTREIFGTDTQEK